MTTKYNYWAAKALDALDALDVERACKAARCVDVARLQDDLANGAVDFSQFEMAS